MAIRESLEPEEYRESVVQRLCETLHESSEKRAVACSKEYG
jgi:hypothetical protein